MQEQQKQLYGVVCGSQIVAVHSYERALEEAAMWTLETGVQHTVQPVKPKKRKEQ